ncbi:hypothetical protein SAMN04488542_1475 [Fontibacillus panacisegetis]|uniref:Lipoprotein n=1 Tax=Fontibacillus panacisegetis TaxID=670482 RepID=A0A1G7ULY0_9BACL|nr:hypothetical protein [Fontibacillus panacisegetis]SDG48572.1 hypothetical protein SAMN04488542_1475 [Fontibacillus panacisegetis]
MKVRLLLGPLLAIALLLSGCGYDAVKEQKVKKELAQMALDYVKEKYGMKEAKLAEVKLSHGGYNGPIPDFKHEVRDSGVVTLEYNGVSFGVLAGPSWNRFSDEIKNVLSDNYQTEQIKADIQEQLIDKHKVTDEYYLYTYRVSSEQDFGGIDYFTLEQKYDGNLETFLKGNKLGLELEVFFIGNEAGGEHYFEKNKALFHQLASRFSNAESEISLYVSKEDRYMDERMKDILDPKNPMAIDPIIYGPAYNYCKITGETHNSEYVERIRKEHPKSNMETLEVKENRFSFVDIGKGISLASMFENSDFFTVDDVIYSVRLLEDSDPFTGADYASIDPDKDDQYEYKLLNNSIYNVSYAKKSYDGKEVDWSDPIAIKLNRSEVPESADCLFLVNKRTDDSSDILFLEDLSEPYFLASGDSFIAPARTDTDFMIVYRMKK